MVDRLKGALNGVMGRMLLMGIGGITTLLMGLGAWYAKRVGDGVDQAKAQINALSLSLAHTDGAKVGREEFDRKLEKLSTDTGTALSKIDTRLQQVSDLLLSRQPRASSE